MRILSNLSVSGLLGLNSVADANTDTDKFLVLDSSGIVRYRTGSEVFSDIGAGGAAAYTSVLQHTVKAGVALTKGQAVYVTGADGTNMIVGKASNASEATSSKTLGLIVQNLAINDQGFVITEGLLAGLDTSTAIAGDPVWLGTDGNLIFGLLNKPYAPAHLVFIGIVTRVQQNNGEIFVKVQNGFELQELHNVQITSTPADNTVLAYETSTSLYKMKSIPTLLGYTPVTNTRNITINGTTYDLSADRSWTVGNLTGSLTSGYIPKATGATSLANGLMYDTGSAVLIGTQTASSGKFMVYSASPDNHYQAIGSAPSFRFADTITSPNYTGIFGLATATNHFIIGAAAGDMVLSNNTTSSIGNFLFGTGATERMRINASTGNISINNTNNTYRLDVTGTVRFTGQLRLESTITNGTHTYTLPSATGTLALTTDIPSLSGYVPTSRTLTINGTTYDLSADRSWTIPAGVSSVQAGSGISVSTSSGVVTVSNTGLLSATAGSGINVTTSGGALSISNTGLLSASAGSGISVSTSGGALSISNTGLLSASAGSGISVSTSGGALSISNTGILSILAGSGISVSTSSGTTTITNTITNTNQLTNGAGYITGITSVMVTTALGYTPTQGTGTTNYLAKFTGANSIGNSQIFDNGTNVGIGTTSPTSKVHAVNSGNGFIYRFAGGTSSEITGGIFASTAAGFASIGTQSNHTFNIFTNDTDRLSINGSTGAATFSSSVTIQGGNALFVNNAANTRSGSFYTSADGTEISSFNGAGEPLLLKSPVGYISMFTNGSERLRINSSGNVGIGTASPVSTNLVGSQTIVKSYNGDTPTSTTAQAYDINQSNLYLFGRNAGLTMVGNASEESIIAFGNPFAYYIGGIRYDMGSGVTGGDMKFQTGGANERMRITSGGSVGIGTSSPGAYILALDYNASAAAVMSFKNSSASGYSGAHLLNNSGTLMGHFGYANASTGAPLTDAVYFGSIASKAVVFTTGDTERLRIQSNGDISFNGGSGSGQVSTATPKNFRFNNDYSSGYTDASLKLYLFNSGSTIQGFTSGPAYDIQYHTSGSSSGRHAFYVQNSEVMRITNGNVGIGNISPTEKLHLNNSSGTGTFIRFQDTGGDGVYVGSRSNNLELYAGGSERMRITSGGNVGIGTSSPSLHSNTTGLVVRGSARGIIELWDATSGKSVFQNVGGDTYIGQLDKGTGAGRTYILVNGIGNSADIAMTLLANGNVGIGTTSPFSTAKFQVKTTTNINLGFQTGTTDSTGFKLNAYNDDGSANIPFELNGSTLILKTLETERMRITSGGFVGINNSSPYNLLTVGANSHTSPSDTNRVLNWYSVGSELWNNVIPVAIGNNNSSTSQPQMVGLSLFNNSASNNTWSPAITFGGLSTSGGYMNGAAGIAAQLPANSDNNFRGGNLVFYTAGVGAVKGLVEKMRIQHDGNVGIGTTSPSRKLVVNSGIEGISAGISGATYGIRFDNGGTNSPNMSTIHGVDAGLTGSYQPIMLNGLDVRFGTSDTERMRITSGGAVCVNGTSSSYNFYVNGTSQFGSINVGSLGTGTVYSNGGTLTNTNPSDFRLKTNIMPLTYGLADILKLNPVSYNWKDGSNGKQFGFIAQEVQDVMPDAVKNGEYLGLEKDAIYSALVNAIKEQQSQINELKSQLNK